MDPTWEPINKNLRDKLKMDLQQITGSQDNVSYKVALKDKTVVDGAHDEIRRFAVSRDVATSFVYLKAKLVQLFAALKDNVDYAVTWTNGDGDEIVVAGDEELIIALSEMTGPVYRLNVVVKGAKKPAVDAADSTNGSGKQPSEPHRGVCCDNCDKSDFSGFRYKCVVCPDFDLCGVCEAQGAHPGHNMVRIATPENAWPGHFFRRINKMHERIGKRQQQAAGQHHHGCSGLNGGAEQPEMAEEALGNPFWFPGRGRRVGSGWGGPRCRRGGPPRPGHQMWENMMKGWAGVEPNNDGEESKKENADESQQATSQVKRGVARGPRRPSAISWVISRSTAPSI